QRAYKYRDPPKGNTTGDKTIAQLGKYFLREGCRPGATYQPIRNWSGVVPLHDSTQSENSSIEPTRSTSLMRYVRGRSVLGQSTPDRGLAHNVRYLPCDGLSHTTNRGRAFPPPPGVQSLGVLRSDQIHLRARPEELLRSGHA